MESQYRIVLRVSGGGMQEELCGVVSADMDHESLDDVSWGFVRQVWGAMLNAKGVSLPSIDSVKIEIKQFILFDIDVAEMIDLEQSFSERLLIEEQSKETWRSLAISFESHATALSMAVTKIETLSFLGRIKFVFTNRL